MNTWGDGLLLELLTFEFFKRSVSQDQSKGSTKGPEWTSFMVDHKVPGFELRNPRKKLLLWGKRGELMDKLQKFPSMKMFFVITSLCPVTA